MKTLLATSALVIAGLALAAGAAQAETGINPMKIKFKPSVRCTVSGTPVEFPDDLVFTNTGLSPLAVGTAISWKVTSGPGNTYTLAAVLQPGNSVRASGLLPGGVEAGRACKANLS